MRNIRLRLAYDGTNYVGWQEQPNGPSIQAAVEQAIEQLTGCVAQLHEVQAAKAQLASLTPAEVRAALEFRRGGIGEAQ